MTRVATVIYALGGGLGHFTRSLAVWNSLGASWNGPVVVLVSPGIGAVAAKCLRHFAGVKLEELPLDAVRDGDATRFWVTQKMAALKPDCLVVDCFPYGIFGELVPILERYEGRTVHIARWLKKAPAVESVCFDQAYMVETCSPEQQAFLKKAARTVEDLSLVYPLVETDPPPPSDLGGRCLVVHSGQEPEQLKLMDLAEQRFPELQRILISTQKPAFSLLPGDQWLPLYPAWSWYPLAGAVVSACGFNTMAQMRTVDVPHAFLPMPRKFDDQVRRAQDHRDG